MTRTDHNAPAKTRARLAVGDRDLAAAILLGLARCTPPTFSLMDFYDDDRDFIETIQHQLAATDRGALTRRMRVVVRRLVNYGVLHSPMQATAKEYTDEPAKQMNYSLDLTKCPRLAPDLFEHYHPTPGRTPRAEALFLLRHAYPE